jgi:hypothetical protein
MRQGWPGSPWLILGVLVPVLVVVLIVAWSTTTHEPSQIDPDAVYASNTMTLDVRFPWRETGLCVGQFTVGVIESARQVRLGDVVNYKSHGACAGLGGNGKYAWVTVRLAAPLGTRRVIRQSDGSTVPRVLTLT